MAVLKRGLSVEQGEGVIQANAARNGSEAWCLPGSSYGVRIRQVNFPLVEANLSVCGGLLEPKPQSLWLAP